MKTLLLEMGLFLGLLSALAHAGDWYIAAPSDCSNNEPVIAAFVALLPSSIPVHAASTSTVYAQIGIAPLKDIEGAGGERILDQLTLDKSKAAGYKAAMMAVADSYKVPYFVDVTAAVYGGMALSPAVGTAVGLVFTYLLDRLKEPAAAMTGFSAFIAEGGELDRRWKVLKTKDNGYYLVSSLEYTVSVGAEKRRFITAGCTYPVKVDVSEFQTAGPTNNKIIKPHGNAWGVFDIEDNKWDTTELKYFEQDEQFFYFYEDAIENDKVVGENTHRISFVGGPWQYKPYDSTDGKFKSFVAAVQAK
ncbi:hypothetical protein [Rhizobium ruizarguesonis]|uniref:Uncharacterized protein n=1 Tax=Rhizobium ruizarguesonis TaxID=2081791 RepID=A0AAE8TXW4_9HYPH|nr:hypothetical protein [Rhizobium ruizarguesonis]TBC12697.1 hypothetical protein ELH35_37975 [Rhizobium ruizarguesonis]TBF00943.1 hypothetical protein ELG94_39395 [Rhizobium ruizarguesonis]TCA22116.1 hypothetical protein E0H66_37270 [Rhizobium leguminosarum bv. viciae]